MAHSADRDDGRFYVRVTPQGDRWRVASWFTPRRGSPRKAILCGDETEAAAEAAYLWGVYQRGHLTAPEASPETLGELVSRWLARETLSPRTRASYAQVVGMLTAELGEDRALLRVSTPLLGAWLQAAAARGATRTTQATYLRTVRGMWRWALAKRWVAEDPTTGLQVEQGATDRRIRPWLHSSEWPAYLDACEPAHRIRSEFVLHTGLRASELVHARWEWIRRGVGKPAIEVPAVCPVTGWRSKGARPRAVPLNGVAVAALDAARERWGPTGHVFADGLIRSDNLASRTHAACQRAGVPECDFHGLRRAAGARWLEAGVSLLVVSRLLGHRDIRTTAAHYAGVADAELARAVSAGLDTMDTAVSVRRRPRGAEGRGEG